MANLFQNFSMKKKLLIAFLVLGISPMLLIGWLAIDNAKASMNEQAFNQLASVRKLKASGIQRYFKRVENQVITLSENAMIVDAMQRFRTTFNRYRADTGAYGAELRRMKAALSSYYKNDFHSQYKDINAGDSLNIDGLLDQLSPEAIALQYAYIQTNANPLGNKHLLDASSDGTDYSALHEKVHPTVRSFLERFGYYDIFLVDIDSGHIVYSVFKELDYGTSLLNGPYADTNFAEVFRKAAQLNEPNQTTLVDYEPYMPSYEAPASFLASPVFDGDKKIGVLIFQLPIEPINAIMGDRAGLGETGETYLVGPDLLMRSDSYLDPENHSVSASFKNPERGSVKTTAIDAAFKGETGSEIITDYNGNPVLSSYSPLELIDGLTWAVLSEIDEAEAFASANALTQLITGIAIGATILLLLSALFLSHMISTPIKALADLLSGVEQSGDFSPRSDNKNADEVGQIAAATNNLLESLGNAFGEANATLERVGEGQRDRRISGNFRGDINTLAEGINRTIEAVQQSQKVQQQQAAMVEQKAQEKAEEMSAKAKEEAAEATRARQALDACDTCAMIIDTDHQIIYTNQALNQLFRSSESDFRNAMGQFDSQNVIGRSISLFDSASFPILLALQGLKATEKYEYTIGEHILILTLTPIYDDNRQKIGIVVEWDDQTEMLQQQEEERRQANENFRVKKALDSVNTNAMIADDDFNIVYMNSAFGKMIAEAEADIRKELPNFNAQQLMGTNMDVFHKNPSHQRGMVNNLTSTHKATIEVGGRIFTLIVSPVINNGERLGTVVEWQDRTAEVATEHEIDCMVDAASSGDFSQRIPLDGKEGFIKSLSEGLNKLAGTTQVALDDVVRVLGGLAEGNLTEHIEENYDGAFGRLKDDMNKTINKLTSVMGSIHQSSTSIATASREIESGNLDLSRRTESQAASLEETSSSMQDMTESVRQSADNAQTARSQAEEAQTKARQGGNVVGRTISAMNSINDASKQISDIIGVIDEIAFQTNLLALNAAVEAARAGEQGRGFAVVAAEVRNLAQRSASAAKDIKDLIRDSSDKVETGMNLVTESGTTLEEIVQSVESLTESIQQISSAAQNQSEGITQVNVAISQMDEMTQQNAALVEEATAASGSMAEEAKRMGRMVEFFQMKR